MDPLITNGIDPVLPCALEKRGAERDRARRQRPLVPEGTVEPEEGGSAPETDAESESDDPKHTFDDLA